MMRCGCPEEDQQQTPQSPGVVMPEESIVFALVSPLTANAESVAVLSKSRLKDRALSVCRGDYSSYEDLLQHVVEPQLDGNDERDEQNKRIYRGYQWTSCEEIRKILADIASSSRDNEPEVPLVGAFCVVDDAQPDYSSHALVGYSRPENPKFWQKHDREAARANLLVALQRNGTIKPGDDHTNLSCWGAKRVA